MPWPLSQDYNEAIQNPAQCFTDPELRQGEAETNELGLPAPRSGNFADVYAVVTGQRKWAVKCFTRQIPGLQERYQQISLHLAEHKPSFMVGFTFLEQGIRVRGDWYPILKMEWVEGFTLNQFVKSNLHKPHMLDLLSQLWVKLSSRLRKGNIAHCDLQHGNVLLVPASRARALAIKLVDYDGTCVPSLTLLKTIELGHPAYQHPQRQREGIYNLEVDRFSNLVIYTALRGLEVGGKSLWERYDDGDNLLFKPADFAAPSKSRLLYELLKSEKPEVARLARVLAQAVKEPLDKTPLLEELAPEALARPTTVTAGAPASTSPANGEENTFAQLQGGSAMRRPGAAPKKSLKVPLIAAGALLGVSLLVVAGFFLFTGEDTIPPAAGQMAQKPASPDKSRPRHTELIYPPPVSTKTQTKDTEPETPKKITATKKTSAVSNATSTKPEHSDVQPTKGKAAPTKGESSSPNPSKAKGDPSSPDSNKANSEPGANAASNAAPSTTDRNKSDPELPTGGGVDMRGSIPSDAELATALDRVKEAYKDDFNRRKTKELEDLASRLLRQGETTTNDRPLRYVLLREARDKAAEAARADLAVQAVDEMASHFDIPPLEDKARALERTEKNVVTADSIKELVDKALDVVKAATSADNYEVAGRLLKVAALATARTNSRSLQNLLRTSSEQVHGLKKEYDKVKPDFDRLAVDPSDAAANLAVGRYCCFGKKDWKQGLPHLAKGSDSELAELANMELKGPDSPAAWLKLGDLWRNFAAKTNGATRGLARNKAGDWYVKAYPHVNDADAARVEKILSPWAKDIPRFRPAVYALDTSEADDKKTCFYLEPGKTISTRRKYSGPLAITVDVRAGQHSLTLRAFDGAFVQFREVGSVPQLQLLWPDPNPTKRRSSIENLTVRNALLVPGVRQKIQWQIAPSGMAVAASGKLPHTIAGDLDLSRRGPIVITSQDGPVEVYDVQVLR